MFDLLILETGEITVEHTETLFAIEVDIDEHSTRAARNHYIRQLFFGKVQMSDLLEHFDQ